MLNWIRDKFSKRQSVSRFSASRSTREKSDNISSNYFNSSLTMHDEQTSSLVTNGKITLHITYEGDIWVISVDRHQVISDLISMALAHFFDPQESQQLNSKYKFISISPKKVLHPQCTVGEEELKNDDEILLTASVSTGASVPIKLTLEDIRGPSKEDLIAATAHLIKKNPLHIFPVFDCQENFQSEIRKVLYTLVEASAKILAFSDDAKVVFDGIVVRISAKNKKEIDKNAIKYLKDLGFTEVQARYALRLKRNRQIEAMEWLLENSQRVKEDAHECLNVPSTSAGSASLPISTPNNPLHTINKLLQDIRDFNYQHFEPSAKALEKLQGMGFNEDDAVEALRTTNNNQVAACEWLCGERDPSLTKPSLDSDSPLYKALMDNPAIQLGLHNPKILLAFLSILDNPSSANLWLNDVDTAPVLGQVFKTYHSEKHIMMVNQQAKMIHGHQTNL